MNNINNSFSVFLLFFQSSGLNPAAFICRKLGGSRNITQKSDLKAKAVYVNDFLASQAEKNLSHGIWSIR